jgi:hypothetical protein
LDRHDAVHAIGLVLVEAIQERAAARPTTLTLRTPRGSPRWLQRSFEMSSWALLLTAHFGMRAARAISYERCKRCSFG